MVKSMTGYGRETASINGIQFIVEVKTVNHRFSDLSLRIPKHMLFLEDKIKSIIQSSLKRGRIELVITTEGEKIANRKVTIDWHLLDQYMKTFQEVGERYSIKGHLTYEQLMQIPELLTIEEEHTTPLEIEIFQVVEKAVENCMQMRLREGAALHEDILQRINNIKETIAQVKVLAPKVITQYRENLQAKIANFIGSELTVDESRLLTEVALFADKADIAEELTRLTSHCEQFEQIVTEKEPIGRKLDFLVQEMNREANTIGSKANDSQISQCVVTLKSDIEKIKEQVQNIE
jgi:uncharacterized protein (TIGR00255 family)